MQTDEMGSTVSTTERSFDLIDAVQSMDGATILELQDHVSMSRSTVYKHLSTLVKHGYLGKDGNTYRIGPRFLNLGEYASSDHDIIGVAEDVVSKLATETDEEIVFAIIDRGRLINAYVENTKENDLNNRRIGTYHHIHNTAGGKAIIAEYPDERIKAIVDRWGLPSTTENTITTEAELFQTVEKIRERGYAVSNQEFTEGLCAIGGAVHYPNGSIAGSLSISGPMYSMRDDLLHDTFKIALFDAIKTIEEQATVEHISW